MINSNTFSADGNSNTRLIPHLSVHLDALSFKGVTVNFEAFKLLIDFVCSLPDNCVEYRFSESTFYDGGNEYFSNKIQFTHGCVGGFNIFDNGEISYCVKLLGEYFSNCTLINSWRLVCGLSGYYKCDFTRIDIAIDDFSYSIIPIDKMVEADRLGYRMFYKKYKNITERNHLGKYNTTHYFGSRNSGKMLRVYNHDNECLRYEVEFKRQYARLVSQSIASINRCENFEQKIMNVLSSFALGVVDFRDNSGRSDTQKASVKDTKRLEFWQSFIDLLGQEFRVRLPKCPRTVDRIKRWIFHQVSATLTAFYKGLGKKDFYKYIDCVLVEGEKRFSVRHDILSQFISANLSDLDLPTGWHFDSGGNIK